MKTDKIKYIVLFGGLLAVILITVGLILLNKLVFDSAEFKAIKDYANIKLLVNDFLGFGEIVVAIITFITFLLLSSKKDESK